MIQDSRVFKQKLTHDYWFNKLSRVGNDLPEGYNTTVGDNKVYGLLKRSLDKSSLSYVREVANGNPQVEFIIYITLFDILLRKYFSGGNNIITSPDIKNGTTFQTDHLLFHAIFLDDKLTLKKHLAEVSKEFQEVMKHKEFELSLLQNKMQDFDLDLDLFKQYGFSFEPLCERSCIFNSQVRFQLTIEQNEGEDYFIGIQYNKSLYEPFVVEQFLGHFQSLIEQLKVNIALEVSDISILSQTEINQQLKHFNDTEFHFLAEKNVIDLFEEQVKSTPFNIAIVSDGLTLSYSELNLAANQLANYLKNVVNIRQGDLIGIMLGKSEKLVIGILAILKAGATYLPIDPKYPSDRIQYMIDNSGLKACILNDSVQSGFICNSVVHLDDNREEIAKESILNPPRVTSPGDLIYIIYTSGSTGNPKGAMVKHNSFANLINWYARIIKIEEDSKFLLLAPISFDLAQKNVFAPLVKGASLCLSDRIHGNYNSIADLIFQNKITAINLAPSAFYPLLDTFVNDNYAKLKTLRTVILGGEPINIKEILPWTRSSFYNALIVNSYGPTECTDVVSFFIVDNQKWDSIERIPIGFPVDNTKLYVLDRDKKILPLGIRGEIFIGGLGVGMGYMGDPQLTSEKFVKNPFNESEYMYRTGDIGRWLPDGVIDYIGRDDDQIKIRGYRIEISEIEKALKSLPEIENAIVLALNNEKEKDKFLVGYFTSKQILESVNLKAHLSQLLPAHMIPDYFIRLERFPLTPSGKIDKKLLPDKRPITNHSTHLPARSIVEHQLIEIWKDLLALSQIGIQDDFFENGGHSLKAMLLVTRIRREFDVKVELHNIFLFPTIEALAELIASQENRAQNDIKLLEPESSYVLSSAQQRIWVLSQFEESNIAYNIPNVYVFEGNLNRGALELAFIALVNRHESLMTIFREDEEGEIKQIIEPEQNLSFQIAFEDLTSDPDIDATLQLHIKKEYNLPFDLSKGPLLRASLYQLAPKKWVFTYTMHHIISDGWSMGIVIKELLWFYKAYQNEEELSLLPLKIQYKDYAAWQQDQLRSGALNEDRKYWLEKFKGTIPVLDFPNQKPRPSLKTYNGEIFRAKLSAKICKDLKTISQQDGGTLFMGLLTVINCLFYRYTSQQDIIIGTPIAGRDQLNLEDQIGFYVNTLALRTQFNGEDSFYDLFQNIKKITIEAYARQAYPFDELVNALQLKRDLSRSALFDVMVVLQDNEARDLIAQQTPNEISVYKYEGQTAYSSKFDLLFNFIETGQGMDYSIEFNSDIYDKETIVQLSEHLEQIAETMLKQPKSSMDELDFLSDEEKQKQIKVFNDSASSFSSSKTIVDLFEEQVVRTPFNIAVSCDGRNITYQELNESANKLARKLKASFVIKGNNLIGVMLERDERFIVSVLGILKTGAGYVPIDPNYPKERMSFMERDSDCLLTIDEAYFTEFIDQKNQYSSAALSTDINPSDIVYLIYTSGSTGQPKGIMMKHSAMVNLMDFHISEFYNDLPKSVLQFASISFDVSFQEMFSTLLIGATLYPISDEIKKGVVSLVDFVVQRKIDTIFLPTVYFKLMMDDEYFLCNIGQYAKHIIVAGEQLVLSEKFIEFLQLGTLQLHNHYGPAETHVVTTSKFGFQNTDALKIIPSIGRPIKNVEIFVLNQKQVLSPIGVIGEIGIAGVCLSKGYLNQPDLTKDKFIDHPYKVGEKLYRTGDMGFWSREGTLWYVGRKDFQVKINGYRVELGEIENTIQQYPFIENAVVLAKNDQAGDRILVAYIIKKGRFVTAGFKDFLSKKLPAYMIPNSFIFLEKFPLTSNGKLDRRVLLDLQETRLKVKGNRSKATNETERILTRIWEKVLSIKEPDICDNFFEIGGNSLRATRLLSLIHKEFDIKINLKDIYLNTSIQALSLLLHSSKKSQHEPISSLPTSNHYDLSNAQRRLWILSQFEEGSAAYNISGAFKIEGNLDMNALKESFGIIIMRHESLRTVFVEVEAKPRQKINHYLKDTRIVDEIDLSDSQVDILEFMETESNKAFDLKNGPLYRFKVINRGENQQFVLFTMHHIISDGWSIEVLIKELLMLYNARAHQKENPLSPLNIQYKEYADWMNRKVSSVNIKQDESYWLNQFNDEIPVLTLPTDKQRPTVKTYNGTNIQFDSSSLNAFRIRQFCEVHECTLYTFFLSAINTLLYKYTGQTDIVVGASVAGREHAELEDQIGFYVNTLALRTKFSANDSFAAVLMRSKQIVMDGLVHQRYPFDLLVDKLDLVRDTGRSALFDVMLVLQDSSFEFRGESAMEGVKIERIALEGKVAKFDLTFNLTDQNGEIAFDIQYNSDLFYRATVERLFLHLCKLINFVLTDSNTLISKIDILLEEERKQLVYGFNETIVNYPDGNNVLQLFQEQVTQNPNKIALEFAGIKLSYGALNQRSNQLAKYLIEECGVQPNDMLGIMLERSEKMIISILGIIKSGCTYIPIDPDYPRERKEYIIQETKLKVLITQTSYATDLNFYDSNVLEIDTQLIDFDIPTENLGIQYNPLNLAYVLYTSGSTGMPKGCKITHGNLSNYICWANNYYFKEKIAPNFGLFTSLSFDLTITSIFCALTQGGKLHIYNQHEDLPHILLHSFDDRNQITGIKLTPSHVSILKNLNLKSTTMLCAIIGGEEVTTEHVSILKDINPAIEIYNEYGPTEATVGCIVKKLEKNAAISIGKPISNVRIYIYSKQMELCPIGSVGEIFIGGAGLSAGYLNQPDLTSEKFIVDPQFDGHILYKTGDLGRWLADGDIEFLGRIDGQVKIKGYRIELGEIEKALRNHGDIDSAVVLAKLNENNQKELVAYVVGKNIPSVSELRVFLSGKLPAYMIPAYFVKLLEFPLTTNGKIDFKRLPNYEYLETDEGFIDPRNNMEIQLVHLFQELLNKPRMGVRDNFFEVGGDSLKAMHLMTLIHKEFRLSLNLKEIFLNPTVESLAKLLAANKGMYYERIQLLKNAEFYDLSSAQKRLWILSQTKEGSLAYNISVRYVVQGNLNISALNTAFDILIDRYEILRTNFITHNGIPKQKTNSYSGFQITEEIIEDHKDNEQQIEMIARRENVTRFDLENDLLLRASLLKLEENRHVLFFTIHHIICDGFSMPILLKNLIDTYRSCLEGKESVSDSMRIQYKDYSAWQNSQMHTPEFIKHKNYWHERFQEIPANISLPSDYESDSSSYAGSTVEFQIEEHYKEKIKQLALKLSVSSYAILLAAVKVLVYRHTGVKDIVIGTIHAGRIHYDILDQIGFFVNTLPIRTSIDENASFSKVVCDVHESTTDAFDNQYYAFDLLIDDLKIKRKRNTNPLFDMMFVMQSENDVLQNFQVGDLSFQSHPNKVVTSKFGLSFDFKNETVGVIKYKTDLFKRSTIIQYANDLVNLIKQLVDSDETTVNSYLKNIESDSMFFERTIKTPILPRIKPASELEEKMLKIWQELLDLDEIGTDEDFYELGGNSIKVLLLVAEINKVFNESFLISDVFEILTIQKLAKLIANTNLNVAQAESELRIIAFSEVDSKKKNIFFIHDVTGDLNGYNLLFRQLKSIYNVYGIKNGARQTYPTNLSIEELANDYLKKIKTVQPHGNYLISGWSAGGIIAFEIVRQLELNNELNNHLILFDSYPPERKKEEKNFSYATELNLINDSFPIIDLEKIFPKNVENIWRQVVAVASELTEDDQKLMRQKLDDFNDLIFNVHRLNIPEYISKVNFIRTITNATFNYYPRNIIKSTVDFYETDRTTFDSTIWNNFLQGEVHYYKADGDHYTMFKAPYLDFIFKNIKPLS